MTQNPNETPLPIGEADEAQAMERADLPEGWTVVLLESIAEPKLGKTPARNEPRYWENGSIPWVAIADLKNKPLRETKEKVSAEAFDEVFRQRLSPKGTLLLSFKLTIGKVAILDVDAAHNEAIASIMINSEDCSKQYLFYYLQALNYDAFLGDYVKGKTLNKQKLKLLPIVLPPLEEQRAIASVLDAVQGAREATEKVIASARELKRSTMDHLFTYGPVPVSEADQVPTKDTEFGTLPGHWDRSNLKEISYVQTGVAKGRDLNSEPTVEVPYLRVANVQDGYLDLKEMKRITIRERELDRYGLQNGDVLLTEGGDFDKLGRGFIWRDQLPGCVHQNHVFAVRTDRQELLPDYLAYCAQSRYGKSYFLQVAHQTTNLASINSTKLKAFPVPLPTLEEQQQIIEALGTVDEKIAAEEARRNALEALFGSLLKELMTGRTRVGGLS